MPLHEGIDLAVAAEIRMHPAVFVDRQAGGDLVAADRPSHRRQPRHLSLVPRADEAERLGRVAVDLGDAVLFGRGSERVVLAAIRHPQLATAQMAMAVMHGVAAAIGADDQRIVPGAEEYRGKRVRLVVIEEMGDHVLAQPEVPLERGDIEDAPDVEGLVTHHLRRQRQARPPANVLAELLAQQPQPANVAEVAARVQAAARRQDVDVRPRAAPAMDSTSSMAAAGKLPSPL